MRGGMFGRYCRAAGAAGNVVGQDAVVDAAETQRKASRGGLVSAAASRRWRVGNLQNAGARGGGGERVNSE